MSATESERPSGLYTGALLAAFLLLLVLAYVHGLDGPLVLDDRSVLDPVRAAQVSGDTWAPLFSATGLLGRPVAMLSFIADTALSGGSNRVAKAVNLAVHLLNTLLVWLLARQILARTGREQPWAALWIACLWAILPLHVSSVLYTVQRMTLLSATWVLCGLLVLMTAANARAGPVLRWRSGILALCFTLCLALAVLTKENGILLLPLGALLLLFPLGGATAGGEAARRIGHGFAVVSAVFALAALLWFVFLFMPQAESLHRARGWTPLERLATQAEVLWLYVAQILLPLPRLLPFFHDDWAVAAGSVLRPSTLAAIAAWIALAALAIHLRGGRAALAGLGVLFFLLAHALESTLLPLELVFEHRSYLPSLGVVLALACLGSLLPLAARLRVVLALLPLPVLAFATFVRASDWADARDFALRSFELNPDSPRAASQLAATLVADGEPAAAVAVLQDIHHPGARLQTLYIVCTAGREAAIPLHQGLPPGDGLRMDGYATTAAINLSDALHARHCALPTLSFADWLATVVDRGHFVHQGEREKLSVHVAHALRDADRHEEAMRWAETRVPGSVRALGRLLAADWRSEHGDCAKALENLDAAARLSPPVVGRGWASMLADTQNLLAERGCRPAPGAGTLKMGNAAADSVGGWRQDP